MIITQLSWIGFFPKCPISAYSASAPVSASTTDPSARKASLGSSITNRAAQIGLSPHRTSGR